MLSRNNIAYDLEQTPHLLKVLYQGQEVVYHFSSELYVQKFRSRLEANRKTIEGSLFNRFGFNINIDLIADLRLYNSIEKRGFLIHINGEKAKCLRSIILDGARVIVKS